jgi:D-alanyl-D-alanine carboxypeptidase
MWRAALALTLAALFCLPGAAAAASPSGGGTPSTMLASAGNPLPACAFSDVTTPLAGYDDWRLTLLDTTEKLPGGYVPPDLVSTRDAGLNGGNLVRRVALADLKAMTKGAAAAHAPLAVVSAYRSYSNQVSVFSKWVRLLGTQEALLTSARPGHSEHQLGLAIDFKARGGSLPWAYYNWATATKAGKWLAAHAWQYGFVMSYPLGKTSVTCYDFEPWHYRYVGRSEAAAVHASGQTLREWLWTQQPQPMN